MRPISLTVAALALLLARPVAAQCPDGTAGSVLINEVQVGPKEGAFIELVGPPGALIDCLSLVATNGGEAGDKCDVYATIAIPAGTTIPEDGIFLIATADTADLVSAKADLQNGPDAVTLVHTASGAHIDTLAYGGALDACETPVVEGGLPALAPANGKSIGRADGVDTNVNGKDFQVCAKPTPGGPNDCPAPASCGAEPVGAVRLSELRLKSGVEFVELVGDPGTDLGCYALVQLNGGTAGDKCDPTVHALAGRSLDAGGFAVIEIDLQVGPDAVKLVWKGDDEDVLVDGVAYGAVLGACPEVGSGHAAPAPKDNSLSRCGTSGNDSVDWVETPPTPGESNNCPAPCGDSHVAIVVNEVVYDPDTEAFVELKGPPGTDLRCYSLLEINGGTGGATCKVEKTLGLGGLSIPPSGYLVIAKNELAGADMVYGFAFQNGPDAFRVVFNGTSGTAIVDQLAWNGEIGSCTEAGLDKGAGPKAAKSQAVARCPDGADTGAHGADLGVAAPTPGGPNVCGGGGGGGGGGSCKLPTVVPKISEIQVSKGVDAFIEIWGEPGTDLSCFSVLAYNGATGTKCDVYATIPLTDEEIPASGYFVITKDGNTHAALAGLLNAKADLQDGPDGVALVFAASDGPKVVDSLVYGADLPTCTAAGVGEGKFAKKPGQGQSLTRCEGYDTDENSTDFAVCKKPSPGEITTCGCTKGVEAPPGGSKASSSGSGCSAAPGVPLGSLLLLLWGLAAVVGRRRSA